MGRDREYLHSDESRILRYVACAPKISTTHLEDFGDPISIFVEEQVLGDPTPNQEGGWARSWGNREVGRDQPA